VVLSGIKNQILDYGFNYWILDFLRSDSQVTLQVLLNNPDELNAMFEVVYSYPPREKSQNQLVYVLKIREDWYEQEMAIRGK